MEKENVVIVSGVRTPFDKFGGPMRSESTVTLGAFVVKEAIRRAGIQPDGARCRLSWLSFPHYRRPR